MDFKKHKRKGALSELIQANDFISQGGWFKDVSISQPDQILMDNQHDVFMCGYIARNPDNHNDMWYVSKEYYDKNLEEVKSESKENFNFGQAIEAAKQGKRVARLGWNGQNMFAYIVPAASYPAQTGAAKAHFGENAMVPYRAYWALKTAQEDVATWTPSGSDTLAEDWIVLDQEVVEPKQETFLDRLQKERDELSDKLVKLEAFLLNKEKAIQISGEAQYDLLLRQSYFMSEYLNILDHRLILLEIV